MSHLRPLILLETRVHVIAFCLNTSSIKLDRKHKNTKSSHTAINSKVTSETEPQTA